MLPSLAIVVSFDQLLFVSMSGTDQQFVDGIGGDYSFFAKRHLMKLPFLY